MMTMTYGQRLRNALEALPILPFIGVYDVFSAGIAARHFDALFISGFGFAASHYGLPDRGYIAWPDMVAFVQRVRTILPEHHLLVDIDDGYGDPEVASHVVGLLERAGASGVVLEDQKRPRKCGHFEGKQILDLPDAVARLKRVLAARRELFVVARSDASEPGEVVRRVKAFADSGADAILVDGLSDPEQVTRLPEGRGRTFVFNQIAGGKSPPRSLSDLRASGVSMVIYSTPCLFAAQAGIEGALRFLRGSGGVLPGLEHGGVSLKQCNQLLEGNLASRDGA